MRVVAGTAERTSVLSLTILVGAMATLAAAVLLGAKPIAAAAFVALLIVVSLGQRTLLKWPNLLALMILVILFVPMRRYTLPGSLPFELDPFRLLVLVVLVGWTASLLADPRVRLRRSGLEAPLVLILGTTVASVLANGDRVSAVGADVAKGLTFFLSYLVVFFLIVSVTRTPEQINFLIKIIVGGGAIIACSAIVESRTHYNPFDHLSAIVPILHRQEVSSGVIDTRGFRAFGSAQHPIALSAALVLLVPISLYLARQTGRRGWWLAAGLLLTGTLATMSRTSIIMLLVVGVVFVWLKPKEMRRYWPLLLPALVLVHFALPGTLGTLKQSFFPSGGLVAQQAANVGYSGQGRLADLGPALDEWAQDPLFGSGYGTRVVGSAGIDGQILDDQWLGTLLETGLPGALGWLWLIASCARRFARIARADDSARGWLATGLAAAVTAFGAGMLFYDAFAFIQVTLVFFILIALGSVLVAHDGGPRRRQLDGATNVT